MVSPELLRRYPFFANLSHDQLVVLAKNAAEHTISADKYVFYEDEKIDKFYLLTEGGVSLVIQVPDRAVTQTVSAQLTGGLQTKDVVVSTLESGDVFGWSSLLAPYAASAGSRTENDCRIVAFDSVALRQAFADDREFGFAMMEKIARTIRDRMHNLRTEAMAYLAE